MKNNQYQKQQLIKDLHDYLHHPVPRAWDAAFAEALIAATARSMGRLHLDAAWLTTMRLTQDARMREYEQAANAVDAAYHRQDLPSVAATCRHWWRAAKALQTPSSSKEASA